MKNKSIKAELCRARGGARAIATLTFDDGVRSSAMALSELLTEYGLVASLMVVPTRIMGEPPYSSGYLNVDEINGLMAAGTVEPESHSYSHMYIAAEGHVDYKRENCTDENRIRETVGSRRWLREHFSHHPFVAFAVPGGSYDEKIEELVMKTFYSSRRGGLLSGEMQLLTPPDNDTRGGWYGLHAIWLAEERRDEICAYLDKCIAAGGWFISGCHNIVGTELHRHNYDITVDSLREIFGKIREYRERGDVWVASFSDATRYLREYESSSVVSRVCDTGISVEVTMKAATERGLPLDSDIFNLPLTVRLELPCEWERVSYTLEGRDMTAEARSEGGTRYAYIEVVPNSGEIIINEKR